MCLIHLFFIKKYKKGTRVLKGFFKILTFFENFKFYPFYHFLCGVKKYHTNLRKEKLFIFFVQRKVLNFSLKEKATKETLFSKKFFLDITVLVHFTTLPPRSELKNHFSDRLGAELQIQFTL